MPTKAKQSENKRIPKLRFSGFSGEWKEKRLGEVATFLRGRGISKDDISEDGKNKCIRYGELYTEYNGIINEVVSKTDVKKEESVLSKKDDLKYARYFRVRLHKMLQERCEHTDMIFSYKDYHKNILLELEDIYRKAGITTISCAMNGPYLIVYEE